MHVGTPRGILRDTAASPKRTSNRSTLPPRSWMSGSRTRSSPALRARWILLARLLRALLEECNSDASNDRASYARGLESVTFDSNDRTAADKEPDAAIPL